MSKGKVIKSSDILVEQDMTQTEYESNRRVYRGLPEDATRAQWLKVAESSLGFWNQPQEDVYTENDGDPI